MNCSVKFFVPIVIVGTSDGAGPAFFSEPELPPQPANATIMTATAAVRWRGVISGYGCLVPGSRTLAHARRRRQLNPEGPPLARLALSPDPPAVVLDDPLAYRQADSRARIAAAAVQAMERLEDLARVLRVHPDAVVGHREAHHAVVALGGHRHVRIPFGELDRVADEVLEHLTKVRRIAGHTGQLVHLHHGARLLDRRRQHL